MTRLLSLAAITTTGSLCLLFAACSGSSGVTFLDASAADSGQTSSGGLGADGGATDGGKQCAPCAEPNPDPSSCTTTDPCQCGPFTCLDSGTNDSCTWGAVNTCGAGKYCNAPGCKAKGKCVAIPAATTETAGSNPQCGCDGISYWNPSVAATRGISLKSSGECKGNEAAACPLPAACPTGTTCNLEVNNLQACTSPVPATGTCWATPVSCLANPSVARSCGDLKCASDCEAIAKGTPYFKDNACRVVIMN